MPRVVAEPSVGHDSGKNADKEHCRCIKARIQRGILFGKVSIHGKTISKGVSMEQRGNDIAENCRHT